MHLKSVDEEFPETAKVLDDDLYVDDLVTGTKSVKDGVRLALEAKEILKKACFNLRKFNSNSELLLQEIGEISSGAPIKLLCQGWSPT